MTELNILDAEEEEIRRAVKSGEITVSIFGLGNMGLPLAVAIAKKGARVIGFDIDNRKVSLVNAGKNYLPHEPGMEDLLSLVSSGRLKATSNPDEAVKEADIIIVIVPLLVDERGNPNFRPLISAVREIGKRLAPGKLVIIETTVPPGTTEGVIKPLLEEESGLKADKDFGLAFSPERLSSGRVIESFYRGNPKLVAGVGPRSSKATKAFYSAVVETEVIVVSSPRVAEAAKLFKEIFRFVNIALADEFAKVCDVLGVDYNEVREAANTDRLSMLHMPGPKVGGHCIPVYPHLLRFAVEPFGVKLEVVEAAEKVDASMPSYVIFKVFEALNEVGKPIKGSKIAVLGLTYRGGVKSTYLAPAKFIIPKLVELGAVVVAHDPMLSEEEIRKEYDVKPVSLDEALASDLLLILADHKEYLDIFKKMKEISRKPLAIVDAKNILSYEEAKEMNIVYRGLGRSKTFLWGVEGYLNNLKQRVLPFLGSSVSL